MLSLFKKLNRGVIIVILTILVIFILGGFAYYWYKIIQEINWGKKIALDRALVLKINERAYYKKEQAQIQFIEITDSRCQPDKMCVWAGDLGAQFSATNYQNNNSSRFYLSQTMVPQMPLFDLQIQLIDINKDSGTVKLKVFSPN